MAEEKKIEIIQTEDGSHSLFLPDMDETYHSSHGAIQESRHVFIKHGLDDWAAQHHADTINILEIGFGTGLNALLAYEWAHQHKKNVVFYTLEAYPLKEEITTQLNYPAQMGQEDFDAPFQQMHQCSWGTLHQLSPYFSIYKIHDKLETVSFPAVNCQLVFFDAFAPSKQEEMWALPLLEKVTDQLVNGGALSTYCAKGQLKRDLKSLGLTVESLPGPPGKFQMVRASKA
ncbi:tRNA (5-methylaminomethyl-2-thiouridine)(34)-methyltransferase MnmD [Persicobacter psychrovividus]|uniref:MnmC-like methyltransferase domain-containing protein n=1 Tax=Persicobacter psychrovividus TaxID=387638 RepID=A0ABM7VAV7_9BACT|nr:hypothetical protein PEPS_03330 [Persicobacter psychrovividus]